MDAEQGPIFFGVRADPDRNGEIFGRDFLADRPTHPSEHDGTKLPSTVVRPLQLVDTPTGGKITQEDMMTARFQPEALSADRSRPERDVADALKLAKAFGLQPGELLPRR